MKIPILVLTLVVIYGTCGIYADESINLTKEEPNDGNHISNFVNIPLEKSLSRNKRFILLPTAITLKLIQLANSIVIKSILDIGKFMFGLLTGQKVCAKVDKLSFDLIEKLIIHPIEAAKIIICAIFQTIANESFKLFNNSIELLLKLSLQFLRKIFLPGLHTILNTLASTGLLPPSLKAFVDAFNVLYNLLKIIGFI